MCCFVFIVRFAVINGQTYQNIDEGWPRGLAVLNDSKYGYSAINFHYFHVVMLCCFVFVVRFVVINGQIYQNMDEGWPRGLAVLNDSKYGYSAINFHYFHVVMLCCFVFVVRFVVINGQTGGGGWRGGWAGCTE